MAFPPSLASTSTQATASADPAIPLPPEGPPPTGVATGAREVMQLPPIRTSPVGVFLHLTAIHQSQFGIRLYTSMDLVAGSRVTYRSLIQSYTVEHPVRSERPQPINAAMPLPPLTASPVPVMLRVTGVLAGTSNYLWLQATWSDGQVIVYQVVIEVAQALTGGTSHAPGTIVPPLSSGSQPPAL